MAENDEPTQPKGLLKKLRNTDDTLPAKPDGEKRAQFLIAALHIPDEQARMKAVHALIDLGVYAVPLLIQALADPNEQVWRLASVALVKIGQPAVQPLVDVLKSENEQTRLLAAAALHKMNVLSPGTPGWNLMWQEYRKLLRAQRESKADSH